MKAATLGIVLLAASASAQVLRPVDPNQKADVSDKKADVGTLQFDTLQQPVRTEPVTPLSGKMREPPATIADKKIDPSKPLAFEIVPSTTIPQQNFTAKRATLPDKLPPMTATKPGAADINPRVIKPFAPGGAEELKNQLDTPH